MDRGAKSRKVGQSGCSSPALRIRRRIVFICNDSMTVCARLLHAQRYGNWRHEFVASKLTELLCVVEVKNHTTDVSNAKLMPNPAPTINAVNKFRIGHGTRLNRVVSNSSHGIDHGIEQNRNIAPGTFETEPRHKDHAPK